MIDQDIQIIERIKQYAKVNELSIEDSLENNKSFLGRFFGINTKRISALYSSYYTDIKKKKALYGLQGLFVKLDEWKIHF